MRASISIVSLIIVMTITTSTLGDEKIPTPSEEFNNSLLKMKKSAPASISPAIANSNNPHVKPFAATI